MIIGLYPAVANALGICALKQFKTVRYYKASAVINELSKAEKLDTYQETRNQMASYGKILS